jgi:hypothetical protein
LSLAVHSDDVDDLIEQLIATPKENVQRFKKKLSGLKRRKRFILPVSIWKVAILKRPIHG